MRWWTALVLSSAACGRVGFDPIAPVEIGDAGVIGAGCIVSVNAGLAHTCALDRAGNVTCWGRNDNGELGRGSVGNGQPTPGPVSSLTGVTQISTRGVHTCGVRSDTTVWCWGENFYGQLGDGTTMDSAVPIQVPGLSGVVEVATSRGATCTRKGDGSVWCWGNNDLGVLGDGTTSSRSSPGPVIGLPPVVELSMGAGHACARTATSAVYCWGDNAFGQTGDGTVTTPRVMPAQIVSLPPVAGLAGGSHFACARGRDGAVHCWGENASGELGDGTMMSPRLQPVEVSTVPAITSVHGGSFHACSRSVAGSAWCWGDNAYGQTGDTTAATTPTPIEVPGLDHVVDVTTGGNTFPPVGFSCALRDDATVWCWGTNASGQLGDGSLVDRVMPRASLFACP